MPRSKRVPLATARAEETIKQRIDRELAGEKMPPEVQEETQPIDEQEAIGVEAVEPEKPRVGRPRKDSTPARTETHRGVDEDFFDYINRVPTELWSDARCSGLYIYKLQSGGNLPIKKGLRRPITFDELRDLAIKHGPGNYKVQFQHRFPHLSVGGEVISFDADSLPGGKSYQPTSGDLGGMSRAVEAIGNIAMRTAETGINAVKSQIERDKPIDVAALVTAFAQLIPKQDNQFLTTLLDNQRRESQERADRDRKEAQERAERDQRFFALMTNQQEKAANERTEMLKGQLDMQGKFFEAMMAKEKERTDSLSQFTGLIKGFLEVREKIEDSFSGGRPAGWEGIVSTAIDRAGDILPHLAALRGQPGMSVPQGVPQQQPNVQANSQEMQFHEMIARIARYLQRDVNLWDGRYVLGLIEVEYGGIYNELMNQPKEVIVELIKGVKPIGEAIMAHEAGASFMSSVIDAIKDPDRLDELFPEQSDLTEEPEPIQSRRVNGKTKGQRA